MKKWEFVRNIYGDEIRYLGWKRSIWKKGRRIQFRDYLYYGEENEQEKKTISYNGSTT